MERHASKIEHLERQIALNDQQDKAVREAIGELKSMNEMTQKMIQDFITKYSFVLDKMVDQEKKK